MDGAVLAKRTRLILDLGGDGVKRARDEHAHNEQERKHATALQETAARHGC